MRATASSGKTERPTERGVRRLSFEGTPCGIHGFVVSCMCVTISIVPSLPVWRRMLPATAERPAAGACHASALDGDTLDLRPRLFALRQGHRQHAIPEARIDL